MKLSRLVCWCLALGMCLAANASAQTRTASGAATAAIRAARNTRRSIKSTGPTSRTSGSPGGGRPSIRCSAARIPKLRSAEQLPRDAADGGRRALQPERRRPRRGVSTPAPARRSGSRSLRPAREALRGDSTRGVGLLARRQRRAHLRAARRYAGRAQRQDRAAVCRFRRRRRRQPPIRAGQQDQLLLERRAARLPGRRDRRRLDDRLATEQGGDRRATCGPTTSAPGSCAGRST